MAKVAYNDSIIKQEKTFTLNDPQFRLNNNLEIDYNCFPSNVDLIK